MSTAKQTPENETVKVSDVKLSAAIMLSVDVKAAFEMYAYRVISPEVFADRLDALVKDYKEVSE